MSFYKEIDAGSWEGLADQGTGHIVPISSGGLATSDRQNFFRKTAASEQFLYEMRDIKLADGEVPIHVNAVGSHSRWGNNRKGDSFSESTLRQWHPTFVTEGNPFIHHRNRDPKMNYGKVASSCYNDKMHRVELLIIANTNQQAAKKNAGLVLPAEFLEKIEKNAELAVSMGCMIKHDICSWCGNTARTRAEYCDETNCRDPKTGEWGFGCKSGLAKVASSGRVQYVDNIDPRFFDISFVGVPADRTAYGFVADYIPYEKKTAALGLTAEDYFNIGQSRCAAPMYVQSIKARLHKLAALETSFQKDDPDVLLGFGLYASQSDISLGEKIASLSAENKFSAFRILAETGVLLSPEAFSEAIGLDKSAGLDIRQSSKNIYGDIYSRCSSTSFDLPASVLARLSITPQSKIAEWSLPVAVIAPYRLDAVKTASFVKKGVFLYANQEQHEEMVPLRDLAEAYALYKAAALCCFPKALQEFGEKAAVLQTLSLTDLEK